MLFERPVLSNLISGGIVPLMSGEFDGFKTYIPHSLHQTVFDMAEKTLFERIADREIPSDIVFEDSLCLAFRDIDPQAPTHILVVPRKPIPSLDHLEPEDAHLVGHLVLVAKEIAEQEGLVNGYRAVFNCGRDAFQTVPHIHLHILGGRRLGWPPG